MSSSTHASHAPRRSATHEAPTRVHARARSSAGHALHRGATRCGTARASPADPFAWDLFPSERVPYPVCPLLVEASLIFLVALAGGLLPLVRRWTDRQLHAALALATGVFLGAVFLHLLPALAHLQPAAGSEAHAPVDEFVLWGCVLLGLLGVYLVEGLLLRSQDHDDLHRVLPRLEPPLELLEERRLEQWVPQGEGVSRGRRAGHQRLAGLTGSPGPVVSAESARLAAGL